MKTLRQCWDFHQEFIPHPTTEDAYYAGAKSMWECIFERLAQYNGLSNLEGHAMLEGLRAELAVWESRVLMENDDAPSEN